MGEQAQLTPREIELTAELLSALDSELRLQLLLLLNGSDRVVHQMVSELGKSQPLISQHLRILKSAGLVTSRRSGREVLYSLADPAIINVIVELAALAATGELDKRRGAKRSGQMNSTSVPSAVAIIEPPIKMRPGEDPGLAPSTPKPQKE